LVSGPAANRTSVIIAPTQRANFILHLPARPQPSLQHKKRNESERPFCLSANEWSKGD
jgi:hypothetical protein